MHEWTEDAQRDAESKVFTRAANDAEFRALALRDGRAAVEQATGRSLPDGFSIRFVDPAGAHITAVLPHAASDDAELADHELMAVAGGKGGKKRSSTPYGGGTSGERPQPPGDLPSVE